MESVQQRNVTYRIARDFLGLRSRRVPAKAAALQVAAFHGVSETRVLTAYELFNLTLQRERDVPTLF